MHKLLEFKATGEKIIFVKTSEDTNGEFVEIITKLPAHADGPPAHFHHSQTETLEVLVGKLGIICDGANIILEAGDTFSVPPNSLHTYYAINDQDVTFSSVISPALGIEYFLTEMVESSNRSSSRLPSAFDASYILGQLKGEYYLGDFPLFIQKMVFPILAFWGKMFGLVKANSIKNVIHCKSF